VRRTAIAALHAGYWLLYCLLLALLLLIGRWPARLDRAVAAQLLVSPIVVLAIVPNIVAFYVSYFGLSQRFLARRRIGALAVGGVGLCLATGVVGLFLLYLLYGRSQPVFARATETMSLVVMLGVLAGIHVTIALVLRGFADWYRDIRIKDALARKTHEMELALVRSRLDPHFLFNTLNNLDVLIDRDPPAASAYLNRLSDIMRFVLYESRGDVIPLAGELDYIDKYIALERLRTRTSGYVTHVVTGSSSGLWIAPMTLIPFVENAFKHTEHCRSAGAIETNVTIENGRVVFECVNRIEGAPVARDDDGRAGGIGHALIRQRLALLYPDRHVLIAGPEGDRYRVHLTIDTTHDSLRHR